MSNVKMSGNFYTVLVVGMFIASIVYLSNAQPAIAPVFTAAMLPFIIGIVGTIQRTEAGVQQSKENNVKIAQVVEQVDANTIETIAAKDVAIEAKAIGKETAVAVDGRISQLVKALEANNAIQSKLIAADSKAEGITLGRAQVIQEHAAAPVEPTGSTPAQGTPVIEAPIMVVAPKQPDPVPGDHQ